MKQSPLITTPALASALPAELAQYTADRAAEGINAPVLTYTGAQTGKAFKNYIKSLGAVESVFLLGDLPNVGYTTSPDGHAARRSLGDYYLVTNEDFGWIDDSAALQGFLLQPPFAQIGRLWFDGTDVEPYRRYLNKRHRYSQRGAADYPCRVDVVNHLQYAGVTDDLIAQKVGSTFAPVVRQLGASIADDGKYGNDGTLDTEKRDGALLALWLSGGSPFDSALFYVGDADRMRADDPAVPFACFFGSYLCDYYAPGNLLRTYLAGSHGLAALYNWYGQIDVGMLAGGSTIGSVALSAATTSRMPLCNLLGDPTLTLDLNLVRQVQTLQADKATLQAQYAAVAAERDSLKAQLGNPVLTPPGGTDSPGTVKDGLFTTLGPPAPWRGIYLSCPAWTGNYFVQTPNSAANNGAPPAGNTLELQLTQWPTANGQTQFAEQTLTGLTAGQVYTVLLDLAFRQGYPRGTLLVKLGGAVIGTFAAVTASAVAYDPFLCQFTAKGSTGLLRLENAGGGGIVHVGNVRVI